MSISISHLAKPANLVEFHFQNIFLFFLLIILNINTSNNTLNQRQGNVKHRFEAIMNTKCTGSNIFAKL